MTRQAFILLLCVYGLVVVAGFVADKFILMPDRRGSTERNLMEIFRRKPALVPLVVFFTAPIFVCSIIGYVGLFFFWRMAPWIFAFGTIGRILLNFKLAQKSPNDLQSVLNVLELILVGFILALVFVGPVNRFFF
jgi:hypothetical protein